jgi:tetratricopeptide (TPR) repeat protein
MSAMKRNRFSAANSTENVAQSSIWTRAARGPDGILAILLFLAFIAGGVGLPGVVPLQAASWMAFGALVLAPGYFLALLLTWHLEMDWLDRLAMSFPLGIAALTPSGLLALLLHLTADKLLYGWLITTVVIILAWMVVASKRGEIAPRPKAKWARDEIVLLVALLVSFLVMWPALTVYRVDGDLFTFLTKVSDALTGAPMNVTEPIFGTDLGAGVRSEFNQFFPLWTLWSMVSRLDPVALTGNATRAMIGLLALLAAYSFGKALTDNNRRIGLLIALLQSMIYMAEPFFRPDDVSVFFLERTNADKFTVAVTMLPVVFALVLHFWRHGRWEAILAACVAAFAVSAVHPLIAAMLALAVAAFGGISLLMNLRSRQIWGRTLSLAPVAAVSMFLPMLLFLMAHGSAPLAPTYPESFDGWPVSKEATPVLPFVQIPRLDWYGPTPELSHLEASDAQGNQNPFLAWRFIFNLRRQRLVIFDLHRYISDPSLMMEPTYLLALLMAPLLLWRPRYRLGTTFLLSITFAMLTVMYNPIITPVVGSLIVPWLLWRFIWLLPYSPIIILAMGQLRRGLLAGLQRLGQSGLASRLRSPNVALAVMGIGFLASAPMISYNLRDSIANASITTVFPTPLRLLARLDQETRPHEPVIVAADSLASIPIPVYAPNANIIGHRIFNTSEFFPADQQDRALQRLIDQDYLFRTPFLTQHSVEIMQKYEVRYIVTTSGSDLDAQLRLAPQWFEWLIDDRFQDQSFSLYAVHRMPEVTLAIDGNTYLQARNWEGAEARFVSALRRSPSDQLALAGMADLREAQGRFKDSLLYLQRLDAETPDPIVDFDMARLYGISGQTEESISRLLAAWDSAPSISRYPLALSDACLLERRHSCVEAALDSVVESIARPDRRLMTLGDLWSQRGELELARIAYEQAAEVSSTYEADFQLAGVLEDLGEFDVAQNILTDLRRRHPLSPELTFRLAQHFIARGDESTGIRLYRQTIFLLRIRTEDATQTRLSLARTLLAAGMASEAGNEIRAILRDQPANAGAYVLLGNLLTDEGQADQAIDAFRTALRLDPTEISGYVSLREEYSQQANPEENLELLQVGADVNPDEPNLLLSLGDQFQQYGDLQAARDAYQRALSDLDAAGDRGWRYAPRVRRLRALAYSLLAQLEELMGNPGVGMTYYSAATSASPSDPTVLLRFGNALRRQNRTAEAEDVYNRAIEMDASYLPPYVQLVELLMAQGRMADAEEMLNQALEIYLQTPSTNAGSLIQLGTEFATLRQGLLDPTVGSGPEALDALEGLASAVSVPDMQGFLEALRNSEAPNASIALARFYQQMNQTDQAVELYRQEIQRAIDSSASPLTLSRLQSGLGQALLSQGEFEAARRAFQEGLARDRTSALPRLGLSRVLAEVGEERAALEMLAVSASDLPGSIPIQVAYAEALQRNGDWAQARTILLDLTRTYPGSAAANLACARLMVGLGQLDSAERIYRHVLDVTPNEISAYTGLANLKVEQGSYDQAAALLETAMEIDQLAVEPPLARAELYAREAQHEPALTAYQHVLQIDSGNLRAYQGMAEIYRLRGDFARAIDTLNVAADLNPTAPDPLLDLSPLYQALGRPELALNAIQNALGRSESTDISLRIALADLYRRQGRNQDALEELHSLTQQNPASIPALAALSDEYLRRGDRARASETLDQALGAPEPTGPDLITLSRALQSQGRYDEALQEVNYALSRDPGSSGYHLQRANLLDETGAYPAARQAYQRATELGANDGRTWLAYGNFLLLTGERQTAAEAFQQGMHLDPTFIPNYSALVDLLSPQSDQDRIEDILTAAKAAVPANSLVGLIEAELQQDQLEWETAEATLRAAIGNAPGSVQLHLALGGLELRQGKYQEAIASFEHAARIDTTNVQASLGIAEAQRALGDRAAAISTLEIAWERNPPSPQPQLTLAELYRLSGRPQKAEEALLAAAERFPGDIPTELALIDLYMSNGFTRYALARADQLAQAWPNNMQVQIAHGSTLDQLGNTEEAEVVFAEALALDSVTSDGLRTLATEREAQGQLGEAADVLQRALEFDPDDPLNWISFADLQTQLGYYPEAMQALKKAIEIDPNGPETWIAMGAYYLDVEFPISAVEAFERAIAIAPTSIRAYGGLVDAHSLLFEIYPNLTNYQQMSEIIAAMQTIAPGNYQVDIIRSRALQDQRRWSEAIQALQEAVAKAPGSAAPYLALGSAYGRTAQYEAMLRTYLQALELEPTNSRALDGIEAYYRTASLPEEDLPLVRVGAYIAAILERETQLGPSISQAGEVTPVAAAAPMGHLRIPPSDPQRN